MFISLSYEPHNNRFVSVYFRNRNCLCGFLGKRLIIVRSLGRGCQLQQKLCFRRVFQLIAIDIRRIVFSTSNRRIRCLQDIAMCGLCEYWSTISMIRLVFTVKSKFSVPYFDFYPLYPMTAKELRHISGRPQWSKQHSSTTIIGNVISVSAA